MPKHAEKFPHGGYIHKKKKLLKDGRLLLHCVRRESDGCGAVVHFLNGTFTTKEEHDHLPDIDHTEASSIRVNLKRDAAKPNPPTSRDLVTAARSTASHPAVISALGTTESLRQVIKRAQPPDVDARLANSKPPSITGKYLVTAAGSKFLYLDSILNEPNAPRIIVFSSPPLIELLNSSTICMSDGTFKSVKGVINATNQLWVLYVKLANSEFVPVVWTIMENRTENSYNRVLEFLKGEAPSWKPTDVALDFEVGQFNSWRTAFPTIDLRGCYFHYCKMLHTHCKQMRLDLTDRAIVTSYNRLRFLPYVPPADVRNVFDDIVHAAPNGIAALLNHIDRNYVGNGRIAPRFPISIWSLVNRLNAPRTSCSAESFNSLINRKAKLIGGKAKLATLLNLLRSEEARLSTGLPAVALNSQLRLSVKPSSKIKNHMDKIDLVFLNPNNLNGLNFLDWANVTVGRFK